MRIHNYPKHSMGAAKRPPGGILLSLGFHQPSCVEVLSKLCHSFVEDLRQKTSITVTKRLPWIGHLTNTFEIIGDGRLTGQHARPGPEAWSRTGPGPGNESETPFVAEGGPPWSKLGARVRSSPFTPPGVSFGARQRHTHIPESRPARRVRVSPVGVGVCRAACRRAPKIF